MKRISHYFWFGVLFAACFLGTGKAVNADDQLFKLLQDKSQDQNVRVERILSADTILLETGKKIRLIGIKAPEPPRRARVEYDRDGKPLEREILPQDTLEERAFAFAVKLLEGQMVRVEFDEQKTSEDFVTLAYIFVIQSNQLANTEILRNGYADLQIRPPNLKYAEQLRAAYREARENHRGLQGQ